MDNIGNEQYQKIIQDFPELKVIVKLANTELTPENSTCTRGLWHGERTINEDIMATILNYYDVENISVSRLDFRTGFQDFVYDQDHHVSQVICGIMKTRPWSNYLESQG